MLSSCLLVVHDTGRRCEDDESELTRWQKLDNPLLEIGETDVVSWGDDTSFVQTAVQLDDNLARAVIINFLELSNVAVLLHDAEEFHNDF